MDVQKSKGKLCWYGSGGDILAETDPSGNTTAEYIFFGGKRIAMIPSSGIPPVADNPIYYVEDLLGTSRVITSSSGVVCYDADFYPFGGERSYTNTCPQNYKFAGGAPFGRQRALGWPTLAGFARAGGRLLTSRPTIDP